MGKRVSFFNIQCAAFVLFVSRTVGNVAHGRSQATIDKEASTGLGIVELAIGFDGIPETLHVYPTIWISWNTVPVVGLRIAKPYKLVNVVVWVATVARKRSRRRSVRVVKRDPSEFHLFGCRIIKLDRAHDRWIGKCGQINTSYRVRDCVHHPRFRYCVVFVVYELHPSRYCSNVYPSGHITGFNIKYEQLVRTGCGANERVVVFGNFYCEWCSERHTCCGVFRREWFQFENFRIFTVSIKAVNPRNLIQEGAVLHLRETVALRTS